MTGPGGPLGWQISADRQEFVAPLIAQNLTVDTVPAAAMLPIAIVLDT